jgi:hypothetical protein
MIKFFRKIRQKLLSENKFSKYLIYAIGEIILVVIGILIALSINNWNEEKANEVKIKTTLKQIQADLLNDIQEVAPIVNDYQYRIELIDNFLNKRKPDSYFDENLLSLAYINLFYLPLQQSNQSYENLKNQISNIPEEYNDALYNLNKLYVENTGMHLEIQENVKNEIQSYRSTLAKTYNWMEDYYNNNITNEMKDYLLTSEIHRRQLVSNRRLYVEYYISLGLIKSHSILSYYMIRDVLKDNSELPEIIKELKLDYPKSNIQEYLGNYVLNNEVAITIEKKHGILFYKQDGVREIQMDGIMLQEKAKDSLVWMINNSYLLKFKRDSLNKIDGYYFLDMDRENEEIKESSYYRKVQNN